MKHTLINVTNWFRNDVRIAICIVLLAILLAVMVIPSTLVQADGQIGGGGHTSGFAAPTPTPTP